MEVGSVKTKGNAIVVPALGEASRLKRFWWKLKDQTWLQVFEIGRADRGVRL